jgi:hypothetical protein
MARNEIFWLFGNWNLFVIWVLGFGISMQVAQKPHDIV